MCRVMLHHQASGQLFGARRGRPAIAWSSSWPAARPLAGDTDSSPGGRTVGGDADAHARASLELGEIVPAVAARQAGAHRLPYTV